MHVLGKNFRNEAGIDMATYVVSDILENMNCLSDCWMSAQEALNYGLIDGIMDKESERTDYE